MVLLIFRPFRVGDFLEACGNSGTVIEVGIFYTVVKTGDNRHVTIPNGSLLNSVMINYSKEKDRRVDIELSVAYGTDVEKAKDVVMAIVDRHEKILKDPAPFIRMTAMADSSLKITLRVWTDSAEYWGATPRSPPWERAVRRASSNSIFFILITLLLCHLIPKGGLLLGTKV